MSGPCPRRLIGIDASATIEKTRDPVARIARNTGTAFPVESTIDAIRLSGSLEAMIIDPVYEGIRPVEC